MRGKNLTLFALFIGLALASCNSEQESQLKKEAQIDLVVLGDDLTSIPDSKFKTLDTWLNKFMISFCFLLCTRFLVLLC